MIKIIFIYVLCFFAFTIKAQHTPNLEDLDLPPLCADSKYEPIIKPKELKPNYTTKSYNNDSLYHAYNKDRASKWNSFIGGFWELFEEEMWFLKSFYKFELDSGTVWLFKASTLTAKSVDIMLDSLVLPKGAQLSYFLYETDNNIWYETHGCIGVLLTNGNRLSSGGYSEFYIEYFEPSGLDPSYDFLIKGWGYSFAKKKYYQ